MENYSDLELKKELWSRGYEIYSPKEFAVRFLFTVDDAIDALSELNRYTFQLDNRLPHEVLMEILNDTLESSEVYDFVYTKLKDNIKTYLHGTESI